MPELPEVETIRRDLQKKIVGKKIAQILVSQKRIVKNPAGQFIAHLRGNSFVAIGRRGKLLLLDLAIGDKTLLAHLKMTGQLIYQDGQKIIAGGHSFASDNLHNLPNKYSRVIFDFFDKSRLFFNDMRQFGYLRLVDKKGRQAVLDKFGIEPLQEHFTLAAFAKVIGKRKAPIKSLIMNQQLIAGIGNIYADEICFSAAVLPQKMAYKLSQAEMKKLWLACNRIIKKAIDKRGTTFRDYLDSGGNKGNFLDYLRVYGRAGKKCRRCGAIISKIKIAGRTTAYCSGCQI